MNISAKILDIIFGPVIAPTMPRLIIDD